jgi:subtilisin family serine protease
MRRTFVGVVAILLAVPAPSGAGASKDPLLDEQWGLTTIHAPEAWETARGRGAVIAILDSGVAVNHPDLRANVGRGAYDAVHGVRGPGEPHDHGTWVAGVAAAAGGNGEGISGVAPEARILPVRVCGATCPASAVADGIRYAVRRGADVINMSFYVPMLDEEMVPVLGALRDARRAGVVLVAGAGNNSEPICAQPAASALCVGATDRMDRPTTYSNRDAAMQESYLVAPGGTGLEGCAEMIVSTVTSGGPRACPAGNGYAYSTGTSGASPFVAGAAALLAGMGAPADTIEICILESADDLGPPGRDPIFGYGRLNAAAAVDCAAATL